MTKFHKIFYLGPQNTFSHTAALVFKNIFARNNVNYSLVPVKNFEELINNFDSAELLVVPFENSITSDVHNMVDFIFQNRTKVKIIGAISLKIALALYGIIGSNGTSDITTVFSHPKALEQASEFIKKYNLKQVRTTSTAQALYDISKENNKLNGALASRYIKDLPKNLVRLADNVSNNANNFTRFLIITNKCIKDSYNDDISTFINFKHFRKDNLDIGYANNKLAFIIRLEHKVGSLAHFLNIIAKNRGNLTKIQSRPLPGTFFEYEFLIELTADDINNVLIAVNKYIQDSIDVKSDKSKFFRFLGIYPEFVVK